MIPDNIGKIHVATNRLKTALPYLETAYSLDPTTDHARGIGLAKVMLGKHNDAIPYFREILARDPDDIEVLYSLASATFHSGDRLSSMKACAKLIELKPSNSNYKSLLIQTLTGTPICLDDPMERQAFAACLEDRHTQCVAALDSWFVTVSTSKDIGSVFQQLSEATPETCAMFLRRKAFMRILNSPFVCLGIEQFTHPGELLERVYANVRASILKDPTLSSALNSFVKALAQQMFLSEFVILETPEETTALNAISATFNDIVPTSYSSETLLLYACYRNLRTLPKLVEAHQEFLQDDNLGEIVKLHIENYLAEEAIKSSIPLLGQITNSVSQATRSQYEANPCPRWTPIVAINRPKAMLDAFRNLEVLNAGCGTGQEVSNAAQVLQSSKFTALDISLTSLAYAKRQTREAGISNIDFIQGDILNVANLGKTFDIILSSGVLHHMEDTQAGLNALTDVLKPQGSRMLIALYSKIARDYLFKDIQDYIECKGYGANEANIRQFRQDVLNAEPGHFLKNATEFIDFASHSECRDMLFHVQEHRFTWLDIKAMIAKAGLRPVRVLVTPAVEAQYQAEFPDDPSMLNLSNWHELELRNPKMFRYMNYVWLAHEGDHETAQTSAAIAASAYL